MRRLLLLVLALVSTAALFSTFAARSGGSRGLDRLSNRGVPVTEISPAGAQVLGRLGARDLRLLAQVRDREFFRLEVGGSACFAAGKADGTGATPTDVYCPHGAFPSAALPVYDDPAVEMTKQEPGVARLIALDGIAADGVDRVSLVREREVIASARVVQNAFSLSVAGVDIAGTRLVARDSSGTVVFTRSYTGPPS